MIRLALWKGLIALITALLCFVSATLLIGVIWAADRAIQAAPFNFLVATTILGFVFLISIVYTIRNT